MSQDPFQEREVEKYANPILSRGFILERLTKREKLTSRDELAVELYTGGEKQLEGLRRRLRAMERDGQLVFTRCQCYALPERLDLMRDTAIGYRDGYGFLRAERRKNDLCLSSEQMKAYTHGDQVLAQPLGVDRKDRREVHTVRVLVLETSQIVGRYFTEAGVGFVVPDDSRLSSGTLTPSDQIMGARMGFVVIAELTQRPAHRAKAVGKIVEVLGDNMGTGMVIDITLRTHEISYIWPQTVEQQVAGLKEEVPEEAKTGRVDLRDLPLTTVNGEGARGFGDAVYCGKRCGGGWRLQVAIADVSYYIRPPTPLDREAHNRDTSVYFSLQITLMLPEVLFNGLCSLNPQVDRLCMIYEMTVSSRGRLTDYKFHEAVMSSHARLTYIKVWYILQGDQDLREQYAPLVKHLEELCNLYKMLDRAREERGGISLESEKVKFISNVGRRIERIKQTQHSDAHKLIEGCMILVNISAVRFVEEAKEPALFRIHGKPSTEVTTSLCLVLAEPGLELPGGNESEPCDYAELLESVADHPDAGMLQTILLRSTKQVIYGPENRGHFDLALQSYTHFTSSIRHYPDPALHRAIKYLLAKKQEHQGNAAETGGYRYSMEEISQLGQHCSMAERRADETTRDAADWLECDFMLGQVGNVFKGVISSVTSFGFFVRPNDSFIDGLVYVSSLGNDYYRLDQVGQRLMGKFGSQTYHLNDRVEVRTEAVNMDERKVDFSLISNERAPRNVGKTAYEGMKRGDADKKSGRRRQVGKKVSFEPDSAFRGEKKTEPKAAKKNARKVKKSLVKMQKIATAIKAKRAAKKKVVE